MKPVTQEKLNELLAFAKENSLVEVDWQEGDSKISFRRHLQAPAHRSEAPVNGAAPVPEEVSNEIVVKSVLVGTFHRSVSKDRPPLVVEGNHVKPGERLGVVTSMKIPTDVVSVSGGKIIKIFVNDGDAVEYGQPLFSILPSDDDESADQ